MPDPLHALVGNLWVPAWAIRPGSYAAIAPVAASMPLWLVLHSRNADAWKPCYASREQLGATVGVSRSTVGRHLKVLRNAWLVFEVDRGIERRSKRHRPPARWALDPFTADLWRDKIEDSLARVAEDDGSDGRWVHRAVTSLDAFERRSRILRAQIEDDMPFAPKRPRRRNRSRKGAGVKFEPRTQIEPRGDGFPGRGDSRNRIEGPDPSANESTESAVEGAQERTDVG